jgi:hypothetical protein
LSQYYHIPEGVKVITLVIIIDEHNYEALPAACVTFYNIKVASGKWLSVLITSVLLPSSSLPADTFQLVSRF